MTAHFAAPHQQSKQCIHTTSWQTAKGTKNVQQFTRHTADHVRNCTTLLNKNKMPCYCREDCEMPR